VFTCSVVLLALALSFGPVPRANAQRTPGTFNLGPQVGQPAGLTVKVYRAPGTAYSGLFTTDGADSANLHLHRLRERPLPDSLVYLYYGPGLFLGGKALDQDLPVANLGVSAQAGLNFYAERFEVFVHLTPSFRLLPEVRLGLGGSVGLRYVLWHP
jgi:hypothetical protein